MIGLWVGLVLGTAEVHGLDEIVVTGSRTEKRLADTPVATEVISRAEVEASGAESLAELLEEHTNVEVVNSVGGPAVRLQGLDPEYVLILVDGERATGRVGGAIDLSRFRTEDIERIEIVRGSSSALYGADALGGVVNIITRKVKKPVEAELHALYGRFDTTDLSAMGGFQRGAFSTRLSAGWHRSNGFDLNPADVGTNGSAFNEFNISNRTELKPNDTWRLFARTAYLYRDQNGVDANAAGAVLDRRNRTETFSVTGGSEWQMDGPSKFQITGHYALFRDQFLYDQRGSEALDQFQQTREQLGQLTAQYERLLGESHLLTGGLEGFFERLHSERLSGGQGDRVRAAAFLQDEWTVLQKPMLMAAPGLRVDRDSQFGTHLTPKMALRFDPHRTLVLRASYGFGFRAPGFRELLLSFQNPGVGYVVEGNLQLRPETSRSANVGAEYRPSQWIWASVNVFRNDLENLIQPEMVDPGGASGPTRFQYVNVASARTQGVESNVRLRPVEGLSFEIGYTLTESWNERERRPLEGRALHRGTLSAQYRHEVWGLTAMLRSAWVGARPFFLDTDADGALETISAAPYATLDLHLAKKLGEHLMLFLRGENLFGAGDAQFLAIQPRTVSGGFTARY